ncbi:MAG: prolipoprotein diacylglyceryl transferase [Bacteroidia bacterium]|nr:prolipoprotein diacylglyceryl transferase [Bacteroidia bacterium]
MYPDLSYFFHDLFGTDVDNWTSIFKTFGVFLALTFISAYHIIKKELIRKEEEGLIQKIIIENPNESVSAWKESLINGLIGFFFGFKIPYIYQNFEAFKADPASQIFTSDGNYLTGSLLGVLLAVYYYFSIKNQPPVPKGTKLYEHPYQKAGTIILIAAFTGILGSRLLSILENLDSFFEDPMGQLLSGSGLTIYGGLILAAICVALYARKIGIKVAHMADVAAPALLLGYGVGRMGCQLSGDGDWGIANTAPKPDWFIFPDWAWAYDYPRNVADLYQRGEKIADCVGNFCTHLNPPVFPTPIYEVITSLILFFIVWSYRKKIKTPGRLFFLYVFLSGFSRFFVEMIRVNPRYDLLGLGWSMSQWISAILVFVGLIGFFKLRGDKKPEHDYTIPDMPVEKEVKNS